MSYQFQPSGLFRYALRFEDRGTDVAVLQLNIGRLEVDGVYGKRTRRRVRTWQITHLLWPDGIAGPATQASIIRARSKRAERDAGLPRGTLRSIAFNESGLTLASAGRHISDAGWDVGAFARSSGQTFPGPDFTRSAFDVAESASWTARNLLEVREALPTPVDGRYLEEIGAGNRDRFRWQLAILAHNWPYAADGIARRGEIFLEDGRDDQEQAWIVTASGGRLRTPREWVTSYIARATTFIRWK